MKLPNWFKILWWVVLIGLTGTILFKRFDAITSGQSVPYDVFVFLIFIAIMLTPIFSEIEFFGIKLKKEIEELKQDINIQLVDIKNEIRSTQIQTVNQTVQTFGPPPPDKKLPELQEEIERIISTKLKEQGTTSDLKLVGRIDVPERNLLMFQVRYNIEKQLRRIYGRNFDSYHFEPEIRQQPLIKLIQDLINYKIIDNNFYGILKEILSICNYAIHNANVTDNQVTFVTKNAKQILDYLSQIE